MGVTSDLPDEVWSGRDDDEYSPLEIPAEYLAVDAELRTMSVRDLWQRFLSHELEVEPDFQRHYVWDASRASRYVESLILGLPTPAIFLSEEPTGRWVVIDGHQRLETLFRFMQPLLTGTVQAAGAQRVAYAALPPLNLTTLEILADLNGRGVTALSIDDRKKLWDRVLPVVVLPRTTHPDLKYVMFARLNLGSMSLNNQELRNCLYRGPYNRLIGELSEAQTFLRSWGKREPDKRMRHRELVLRVLALLHRRTDIEHLSAPF